MRFSRLLAEACPDLPGPTGDADVRRVVLDSRDARDGDCFVAVRGTATDGHQYIAQAVANGCAAVVCEDPAAVPPSIPFAVAPDTRAVVGPLAQTVLNRPGRRLTTVGVTGTNGKTTFTYLLRDVLNATGASAAMFGTIVYDTIAERVPAGTTTPSAVDLAEMMAAAVAAGGTHVVMEVSSHALDQHRTDGIDFDAAVFTNLSGDHLDYHGTMDAYLAAKRRLFESLSPDALAVLNRDDAVSDDLAAAMAARTLWYGLSPAADVSVRIDALTSTGSRFVLRWDGAEAPVTTGLIGRHNVYNALAAAATALGLGADLPAVAEALSGAAGVPGRLQRVPCEAPFDVLVDYAHTDDALRNVLSALRPLTRGRLIVVFGCGGDRDRSKRPRMAAAAEQGADVVMVTSDNPRSEKPEDIIEQILAGFTPTGRRAVRVEPDRHDAIGLAIGDAADGDVVLIAGKGHETYQVLGDRRVHFDDVESAGEFLRRRSF